MAFRHLARRRPIPPLAIGALTAGFLLLPQSTLHAEAPPEEHLSRKPIYEDLASLRQWPKSQPTTPTEQPSTTSPTPTERLASEIRKARLFIHAHSLAAEHRINTFMSSVLHTERAFTHTIASLAPPPSTHERVMPGALYVLVAAMTGSIISRNRNILLRATTPFAVGLGAAWIVLPYTMRNVAELVWTYEERVPVVAINHMRVRGAVEEGWRQAKVRGEGAKRWGDEMVREGRERVEGWVRKER